MRRLLVILNVACVVTLVILAWLGFQSSAIEQRIIACEQLVAADGKQVALQGRTTRAFAQDANALSKVRQDGLIVTVLLVTLVVGRWQGGKRR